MRNFTMYPTKKLFILLITLIITTLSFGQTIILFEDFEDATLTYTTNVADDLSDIANENYFGRIDSGVTVPLDIAYTNVQGSGYYGAQDTDSANSGNIDIVTLEWTGIDISDFTALDLSFFVAEDDATDGNEDWDITSSVRLTVQVDGGGFFPIFAIESSSGSDNNKEARVDTDFDGIGDGALITDIFTQYSSAIADGAVLDIRLTIEDLDTGDEDIAIDNIRVIGTPSTKVTVDKRLDAIGGDADFAFDFVLNDGLTDTNFSLSANDPAQEFTLAPGTYTLVEANLPANWIFNSFEVSGADYDFALINGVAVGAEFTLYGQEEVNIIFGNFFLPSTKVTVDKRLDAIGGDADFAFDFVLNDGLTDTNFSLSVNDAAQEFTLAPGTYTLVEANLPANWIFNSFEVNGADSNFALINGVIVGAEFTLYGQEEVNIIFGNVFTCTEAAAICNLNDIDEEGCTIPTAFTDPADVFTGIEACESTVTMTFGDSGDIDICGDGDGANFIRTYVLMFNDVPFMYCEQSIKINDTEAPSFTAPASIRAECIDELQLPNTGPKTRLTVLGNDYLTNVDSPGESGVSRLLISDPLIAEVQLVNDGSGITTDGCDAIVDDLTGKIALIDRGACTFASKAQNAYNAGAVALIIVNRSDLPGDEIISGTAGSALIPLIFVSFNTGELIKNALAQQTVTASLYDNDNVVTDNCDASPVLTFARNFVGGDCATAFTQTNMFTVTDSCGNAHTDVQTITVKDTTPPVLSGVPTDIAISCEAIPAPPIVTALDNCEGAIDVDYFEEQIGSDITCLNNYVIVRSWTATDGCGNTATKTQNITLIDNIAPVINCPSNIEVQCYAQNPEWETTPEALNSFASAIEGCSGIPVITYSDVITDADCGYSIARTWIATDACSNSSSCVQTINVVDKIKPVIFGVPADDTVECDNIPSLPINVTASDECDTSPVLSFNETVVVGSCLQERIITRTWTATDACGNSQTESQVITVVDTKAPIVTAQHERTFDLGCNPSEKDFPTGQSLIDNGYITAWDECSVSPVITLDRSELINNGCKSFLIYYYKAIDDCGNVTPLNKMAKVTYKWSVDDIRDCETNYARYKEGTTNFGNDPELNNGGFGWTNHLAVPGVYTMELYSEGVIGDVGEAIVTYTGETVTVDYRIYEGYNMSEANVYLGFNKYPMDEGGDYSVDLEDFNYPIGALDNVYNYTVGPISVLNAQDGIYVIARGVVCREKCRCSNSKDEGGSFILSDSNRVLDYNNQFSLSSNTVESNTNFSVYPVPFKDEVFVEYSFDYQTNVTIEVYDLKGALLKRVKNNNYTASSQTKTKLDLRAFSDQMFFVKLRTNKGIGIKKIISN